jgi:hypothetical protein
MAIFAPKNPIFGILDPLFSRFFAKFRAGRGDPFFGGAPPGGGVPGVRAEPPLEGARRADGGVSKKPEVFLLKNPEDFF